MSAVVSLNRDETFLSERNVRRVNVHAGGVEVSSYSGGATDELPAKREIGKAGDTLTVNDGPARFRALDTGARFKVFYSDDPVGVSE